MLADERKKEGHLKKRFTIQMEHYVRDKLKNQWSPDQIVGKAKKEGIEMVSHERIYQFIWQDKANGGELHKHLRTGMKKYKKRYGSKSSRGQIPNKVSIEQRPKIVEENKRIGDLESDLIIGKDHKGALLTIVDRYSSFLWIANVKGKKKDAVKKATINILASHKQWIHTITNDNGKEFTEHQTIAEKLQCEVFFAHPYSSWERGLNEYTNKLIRQYFPKNKTLENVDQIKINQVIELLNNRPRKKLGYKTPKEVFYQYIDQNKKLALAS
jgi:IS30 family transposase